MANSPKVSSRAKASLSLSLEHNPAEATEMEKTSLADFFLLSALQTQLISWQSMSVFFFVAPELYTLHKQ